MIWLFCGQSKLAWFLNAGRKSLVFSVSMKLNFKFACVVQIDLIPVKDEIDLVVWLVENGFISEWSIVFIYIYIFNSSLLHSSSNRRLYPQRPSGQAVVTGVIPSPRYVPSFLSRIGFSIPTARRLSSDVANFRSRRSTNNLFLCNKKSRRVCTLGEN